MNLNIFAENFLQPLVFGDWGYTSGSDHSFFLPSILLVATVTHWLIQTT